MDPPGWCWPPLAASSLKAQNAAESSPNGILPFRISAYKAQQHNFVGSVKVVNAVGFYGFWKQNLLKGWCWAYLAGLGLSPRGHPANPSKRIVPQKQPKRELPEASGHVAARCSVVADPSLLAHFARGCKTP